MLFNSVNFLIFFTTVAVVYFISPHRARWAVLLAASYFYYITWQPVSALLLMFLTAVVYAAGLLINKIEGRARRKLLFAAGIITAFSPLLFFKYSNFIIENMNRIFALTGFQNSVSPLKLLLPVGISFFTFKLASYLIDVYKGKIKPERHPGKFALYVSFFPQILAGPIERAGNFIPQLEKKVSFDPERISSGLKLILWGLFKKVVIADRLSMLVNRVYDSPADYTGMPLIIATYLFAFQIFCDFSGYSDMAIGVARILGFTTIENFRRPYFSKSISEFWRRWHISLSSWFRDYVYIPLGGSRTKIVFWCFNVLVVFLVSGLWHGSYWTFIIWGALHGVYLIAGRFTSKWRQMVWDKVPVAESSFLRKFVSVFTVFNLVAFSWIFFRASTVSGALHIAGNLFSGLSEGLSVYSIGELVGAASLIALMEAVHLLQRKRSVIVQLKEKPVLLRWAVYAALIIAIINLRPEFKAPFIYMQF